MSDRENTEHFQAEIDRVIERFRAEYDLTLAEAVGVLDVVKLDMWRAELKEDNA